MTVDTIEQLSGTQKAAVLLMAMGTDTAAGILNQLAEKEAVHLADAIAEIGQVSSEVQSDVIDEFEELMKAQDYIEQGGLTKAREILVQAVGENRAEEILERHKDRPFNFIHNAEPDQAYSFIKNEHPQIIAVILSYLEKSMSAELLELFPEDQRKDISKRIAVMDTPSPDVVEKAEEIISDKLMSYMDKDHESTGGIEALADVLNKVERSTEQDVLDRMEDDDPELADAVRQHMFVFEDITQLTDAGLQKALREVSRDTIVMALKGAREHIRRVVFRNVSERERGIIEEELEYLGPVQKNKVAEAQQEVVDTIKRLESEGEVVIVHETEDVVL